MPVSLDPLTAHHETASARRRHMPTACVLVYGHGAALPIVSAWVTTVGATLVRIGDVASLVQLLQRTRPVVTVVIADVAEAVAVCQAVKEDAYAAVVPTIALLCALGSDERRWSAVASVFAAGADDVIGHDVFHTEVEARLNAAVRRSARDLSAQPTTRLPGTTAIEAELTRRLTSGEGFAACYADLDHFKEFNDRYGYHEGDRVIRMVAQLLHDVVGGVAGSGPRGGFVGHVGGDDFLCVVPLAAAAQVCDLAVETFDLLIPLQYTEADRRAGYYFGKDRRGRLHRVPLMTLSIGVATTERRQFANAAEVSRLASEMKSFAKSQMGSVFAVDRRGDDADASCVAARTGGRPS